MARQATSCISQFFIIAKSILSHATSTTALGSREASFSAIKSLSMLTATIVALTSGPSVRGELPSGPVQVLRKNGFLLDCLLISEANGRVIATDKVRTMKFRPGEIAGINLLHKRYTEEMVGRDLPMKYIYHRDKKKFERHAVCVRISTWEVDQESVGTVTVTQFSAGYGGVASSRSSDVFASTATATATAENVTAKTVDVLIKLLVNAGGVSGFREHRVRLGPGEKKVLSIEFPTGGNKVKSVVINDLFNAFADGSVPTR